MNETIDSVLTFWFGNCQTATAINNDKKSMWWRKNQRVDLEIGQRFKELVAAVDNCQLAHWQESPRGLLASIICTDQFPRNMYRDSAKAFAFDDLALRLAQQAVAIAADMALSPIQRVFVYMPFEHSEVLEQQQQCVQLFEKLVDDAAAEAKEIFKGFLAFAKQHHAIIAQWGRFPHRNRLLGRESSAAEKKFLTEPGSSF